MTEEGTDNIINDREALFDQEWQKDRANLVNNDYDPAIFSRLMEDYLPKEISNFVIFKTNSAKLSNLSQSDIDKLLINYDIRARRYYIAVSSAKRNYRLVQIIDESKDLLMIILKRSYDGFERKCQITSIDRRELFSNKDETKSAPGGFFARFFGGR